MNTLSGPAYDNNTIDVLVTIIVPVYNVEKYLHKCVDSLLEQTYKNLEIFLIDDGSTDKSGQICDEYSCKDHRIKVIHKLNGGQGSARNMALSLCKGDYIAFVDSDDWVTEEYIEVLLEHSNESTVSCCGYYLWSEKHNYINTIDRFYRINVVEFINMMEDCELKLANGRQNNPIGNYLWNKLWPKHAFESLKFPNCKYEDCYIILDLLLKFNNVSIIPQCMYYYRQRGDSTIHEKSIGNSMDFLNSRLYQEKRLIEYDNIYKKAQLLTAIGVLGLVKCNDYDDKRIIFGKNIILERISLNILNYNRIAFKLILYLISPKLFKFLWSKSRMVTEIK